MKKYVTFLDILGFKELVQNNSTSEVVAIYESALADTKKVIEAYLETGLLRDPNILKMRIVSDSIILWTRDTSHESFVVSILVTKTIIQALLIAGLPTRGAIVVGDIEEIDFKLNDNDSNFKSSFLVGGAITDAYQLQNKQNWSGCVVSDSAISQFQLQYQIDIEAYPSSSSLGDLIEEVKVLAKYYVPFYKGPIQEQYVINWASAPNRIFTNLLNSKNIRASFSKHKKSTDSWDVEVKIKNTLDFHQQFGET